MFNYVISGGVRGVDGFLVRVEADVSSGMPGFELVGYLAGEVKEAVHRVRTALKNAGFSIPIARVTVNLAPADMKKTGTGYDLAIAISILSCMGDVRVEVLKDVFVVGELMLSGNVAYTRGILPMLLKAKSEGYKKLIIPGANKSEGELIEGADVICVDSLKEAVDYLNGEADIAPLQSRLRNLLEDDNGTECDFSDVRGQSLAKRGIEIAAAGLHNILMIGPPGAGKTMLARCIPSILPPLSDKECLEVSSIYSIRGNMEESLVTKRPFVAAHHTSTDIGLVGGGNYIRPGAVSMAHTGVLFMDELPEFTRKALEALRQPLEDRLVNITRNKDVCTFPADFMLVATMNPCPCGYYPDRKKCSCSDNMRSKYISKISGPLMDRIDISVTTSRVSPLELGSDIKSESSGDIRKRVIHAHNIQQHRFRDRNISFNSQMNNEDMERFCVLNNDAKDVLLKLSEKYDISARSYVRIVKIARTIADLADREMILSEDIMEAVRFKCSID